MVRLEDFLALLGKGWIEPYTEDGQTCYRITPLGIEESKARDGDRKVVMQKAQIGVMVRLDVEPNGRFVILTSDDMPDYARIPVTSLIDLRDQLDRTIRRLKQEQEMP